jgi:hypothetical protein
MESELRDVSVLFRYRPIDVRTLPGSACWKAKRSAIM